MISGFISSYVIKKISDQKTPKLNKKKCINSVQRRQKCNLCEQYCTKKAISLEGEVTINKDVCSNCNICVSICPTGTMVPTFEVLEAQYNMITKYDDISIGCNKEEDAYFNVECLASLPWEFLAYICLDNKIKLVIRGCKSCKNSNLSKEFDNTLDKLKSFLGETLYDEKVILVDSDNIKIEPREYTRRDLFKLWKDESKRLATNMAPINLEENKNYRIYRSLLVKKIQSMKVNISSEVNYNWPSLEISNSCWGCGICAKICPQKAIEIKVESDGNRKFIHNYTRCTHCGLCKTVCMDKAITTTIKQGDEIKIFNKSNISSGTCLVCNDPIKPEEGDKCIICTREVNSKW